MVNFNVVVAPLNSEDISAARQLLIDGLEERWGSYTAHFNPDVEAFPATYDAALVLVAKESDRIIGTGTLKLLEPHRAEIVRMSVTRAHRRSGVGSRILGDLLNLARQHGVREVVLEITSTWDSAMSFYVQQGFRRTHEQDGNTYFSYMPVTSNVSRQR